MHRSNGHDIPWRIFLFPGETVVKRHTCSRDARNRRPIRVPSREASVAERSVKRSVSTSLTGKSWEDAIHGKARGIIKYRNPFLNHFLKPRRYEGGKSKILSRNRRINMRKVKILGLSRTPLIIEKKSTVLDRLEVPFITASPRSS